MDYNVGFELIFKCFFFMISFQYFYIGSQYMIHDGEKKNGLKNITKNNLTKK